MPEVLALDEYVLAEHLLFLNDVKLTYEKNTSLVTTTQYLPTLVSCVHFFCMTSVVC